MEVVQEQTAIERVQNQIAQVEASMRETRNRSYEAQRQLQALAREFGSREATETRRAALQQEVAACNAFVSECHAWLTTAPNTINSRRTQLANDQRRITNAHELIEKLQKQSIQLRQQQEAVARAIATCEDEQAAAQNGLQAAEQDYDSRLFLEINVPPVPQMNH